MPTFQVRLPAGNDQTPLIHLTVYIRDNLECIKELNITSIHVVPDTAGIADLVNAIQSPPSSNTVNSNPIVRLLASGNQNTVGQVITSLSQQFNKKNRESIDYAVSSKLEFIQFSVEK